MYNMTLSPKSFMPLVCLNKGEPNSCFSLHSTLEAGFHLYYTFAKEVQRGHSRQMPTEKTHKYCPALRSHAKIMEIDLLLY